MAAVQALKNGRKYINIEAGRGAGKSTILGWYVKEAVKQMPRATGVLVGATFTQIKSRTFPSTKEGLELFGLYQNVDYVVGKCGFSLGFEMPFQAPDNWSNVIHFVNGHILVMVSLDDPNSGRGLNSYYVIGDEAALLKADRLFDNVQSTNRAKKAEFEKASMLYAEIFTSTVALTHTGRWFTEMEAMAKKQPSKYTFIKANAKINKMNLRPGWFEEMREKADSELKFNAEILNIRPPAVPDGFYASFSSKNLYNARYDIDAFGGVTADVQIDCRHDQDITKGVPLDISLDFGGRINVALISQYLRSINTVQFLNEFTAKNPSILSDLIKEIIDYYDPYKQHCNIIHLYHDRSGFKRESNSKTSLAQDVEALLRKAGWLVVNKTPNTNNPSHILKFRLINRMLTGDELRMPMVLINENKCANLIISMENAGLKHKDDAFEKDKSSEKSTTIPQEHATHLSDAFDYRLWWGFAYLLDHYASNSVVITNIH
ncbi:MAG: hypothetical protein Q4F57_02545 [Weeksellaceae bacterium]|nr:hypothetical protein [Weeksellaceae bacterium]